MTDNTLINAGSGGDSIRDKDRSGVKTQIVGIDVAIGTGTEALMSTTNPAPASVYGNRDGTGALIHRAYGPLRVSGEDRTLFVDTHDVTLDTTNRWNAATGTNAPAVSGTVLTFGTTTTTSIYGKLTSQPSFSPIIPGFLQASFALNLNTAASTERISGHRFWGLGTSPSTPATTSAATKLTDAIGFEVDTDGKMYAVVYATGVRTAVDLSSSGTGNATSAQPLDGAYHRYIVQIRTDRIYWFVDSLSQYVATQSFVTPSTQTLPVLLQTINPGASVASGGYPLLVQGSVVADTAQNSTQLSDGTYPWRKATVSSAGRISVDASGVAVPVTDNAGSLTVDAPVATPVSVRISNGAANIDTLPISAASLPLPTGAAADATLTGGTARAGLTPQTTGGLSVYRLLSAATTNAANVKASAGQLYGWYVSNANAATRFLKIYNTAGTPTAGSGTPIMTIAIPGGGTVGAGANVEFTNGITFGTGIGITVTGAVADNDTTAIAANEVILNLMYK